MIQRRELDGFAAYEYEGDGPTAVALPGAMLAGMPALWYAIEPLHARGWRIVLVWEEYRDRTQDRRALTRAWRAAAGPADLVIAKSLGNYAAPFDLPAVCLTPALDDAELVGTLRASGELLLVGGTEDPMWNGAVARELGEALELEGADHGLARVADAPRIGAAVEAFSVRALGLRA